METIQQILEAESSLSPRQIIEYMADQFTLHDKYLDWEDFYDIMIGVFGKETKPLTEDEFNEHNRELIASGIYLSPSSRGSSFVAGDFDLPLGKHMRFYLNASDAAGRRQILESIVREFKNQRFKLKTVAACSYGFSRYDNTLLYVGINDAPNYFAFMSYLSTEHAGWFDDEVPLLTRKIGKGTGYAVSPRKAMLSVLDDYFNSMNMSFSSVHSMVLQATFDKAIRDNIEEYAAITDVYQRALMQARFDPESPYLNAGMKDPLEVVAVEL